MRAKAVVFAIPVLLASVAFGQTQVFHFTYTQSPIGIQEITNAIRSVGEITQAYLDTNAKTLTVAGTPTQLATAAWMFTTLDQPAPANQATQEFRPAGSVNDVVRVLYSTHPQTPVSLQEIVNSVRTIPEMTRLFPYSMQNAVVLRGTESQAAMTEWLFHQLDVPAGLQPVQSPAAHQYASTGATNDQVQVLFLTHAWSPQSMQQITNTLRVIPQLTKVFPCSATGAVSVRGATASVALAAWVFSHLDQAPQTSAPGPQEFHMPGGADDVTQVYYLPPATTTDAFRSIVAALRTTMKLPVFPDDLWNAMTIRGTAAQIASADVLIRQMSNP